MTFIDEYLFTHILNRAAVGVDNSPGTFEYYTVADRPRHVAVGRAAAGRGRRRAAARAHRHARGPRARSGRAVGDLRASRSSRSSRPSSTTTSSRSMPALGDPRRVLPRRRARAAAIACIRCYALLGVGIVLLIARDLDVGARALDRDVRVPLRPAVAGRRAVADRSVRRLPRARRRSRAVALVLAALPWRRLGVAALGAAGLAICVWSLQVYMPIAGTHWGMREAMRSYYEQRTIYGEKLVYFGARELADDWHDARRHWTFETFVPDTLQVGQPMTITIQLNKADDERITEQTLALVGTATRDRRSRRHDHARRRRARQARPADREGQGRRGRAAARRCARSTPIA